MKRLNLVRKNFKNRCSKWAGLKEEYKAELHRRTKERMELDIKKKDSKMMKANEVSKDSSKSFVISNYFYLDLNVINKI